MDKEQLRKDILKFYDIEFPSELDFNDSFEFIINYLVDREVSITDLFV